MVEGNPDYAPTSQEIKAMAGQEGWSPNSYSSDPDYSLDKMGAAVEALEEFGIDTNRIMTDGGKKMTEGYAEAVTDAVDEYEGDPRVADAEYHSSGNSEPVPDTNTRERDWSDHNIPEEKKDIEGAFRAFDMIGRDRTPGDLDPRVTEAGESEFNIETPMSDNIGYHTIERR